MRQTPEVNDKPDNFLDNWKKLIKYSNKYWMALFASVFLAAGGNILNVLAPYQMGRMTDVIEAGIGAVLDMDAIMSIGLILVFLYGMGGLFNLIQGWIMAGVTQRISEDLRSDISTKINKLPMSYFSNTTVGDTLSRVTNDVDTIGRALNMSVQNLISAITMLVGSFIMMLITNVTLTFTAVASSAIGLLLMTLIMSRSQKYFVAQQNHLGAVNGLVEETYSGHMIVKSYNAEALVRNDFTTMNEDLRSSGFKAQALSSLMMPIMTFVGNLGYLAVCVVGAALALNGSIPFGVIVVFILYVRLFTQPLSQIAQSFQALQSAAAAGERVFDMLEADEMEDETNKTLQIDTIKGEVEFKHVNFSYEDSPEPVIKDFSAIAKPGQKIAIVGHTGAGKTTIVNLLMRFYEIDSGVITIDGISIQDLPKDTLREQFTMVLQDTWVFEGTIRENLVYNNDKVTEADLVEASKAVGIHHFVQTLPKGYDTYLDEKVSLSTGQKQQLTIARAILADKPMLILDEATSSVDTRTEVKIQEAMDMLMEGSTTFVIAHRLSTIRNADLILVMDEGNIIESGTHDELISQNGFYEDLYSSQFEQA
ncbi:MAG TPA: ABC transporter ATP-binding protein [Atopostipes sp.]|nr:ABC transporter ATP-binding protein [Atopostipes sp.]